MNHHIFSSQQQRHSATPIGNNGSSATSDGGSVRAILALYGFFFVVWCLGLVLGIMQTDGQHMLWGLPLWFSISCIGAYTAVSLALVWVVRRYFA